jgi:hypothetical protein
MKNRCTKRNAPSYHRYGGRGISFSREWLFFDNFLRDMGERPDKKTLDRIDPDGDYSKENCRWATQKQQVANKSLLALQK